MVHNKKRYALFLRNILANNDQTVAQYIRATGRWSFLEIWIPNLLFIVLSAGLYGSTLGVWRSPEQACYTAFKFPLVIFLTTIINGLMNGMYAIRLGAQLNILESCKAILISYVSATALLLALAPIFLFFVINCPQSSATEAVVSHNILLLAHVAAIAVAGVIANVRLLGLLTLFCPSRKVAVHILRGWLLGNLLVGAQVSWNLRPFIGSPGLPVQLVREDALRGTFYESVAKSIVNLSSKPLVNGEVK